MATTIGNSRELSELHKRIDRLKDLAMKDPDQMQKILPSALEDLRACLAELSLPGDRKGQAREEAQTSEKEQASEKERDILDRKRLESILEAIPSAVVVVEASTGKFSYMNRRAVELYGINYVGFDLDAHIARVHALRPDGTPYPLEEMPVSRSLRFGQEVRSVEMFIERSDGKRLPVLVSSSPLFDTEGNVDAAIVIFEDITQRRQTEKTLKESEERLQRILADMTDAYFFYDREWRFVDVNPRAEEYFGRLREELIGKNVWELFPHAVGSKIWKEYHRAMSERVPVSFETQSGINSRLLEISAYPEPGGLAVYFRDITENKQIQEAASLKDRRLRAVIEISQHNTGSIQDLLDYTLQKAIALSESRLGYILHYNEDKREFTLHAWSKETMKECSIAEPPTVYQLDNTGIWGEAVRQRRPVVINDFLAPNPLKRGYPEGHAHLSRFMTVPVFVDDRIFAVVAVANKDADYTEQDVHQLSMMMDSVWAIIERKRRESEIVTQRRLLTAIIDNIPVLLCIWDPHLERFQFNKYLRDTLGWTEEDTLDGNFMALAYPDLDYRQQVVDYMLSLKPGWRDLKTTARDGRVIDISWANIGLDDGTTIGIGIDISERKKIEEELRQSQSLLAQAEKIAEVGSWEWDLKSGKEMWSEQSYRILGIEPGQFTPSHESYIARIHPDHRGIVEQSIKSALLGEKPYDVEYQIVKPSSEICWIHSRAEVFFDEKGQPQSVVGTLLDINSRKQMEEELRQEKDTLNVIMENTNAQIAYLDRDFRFIAANSSYIQGSGHSREEIIGENHFELFPNKENEEIFKKVVSTGEAARFYARPFEYVDQPLRGTTYWDWSLVPITDAAGRVQTLVFSLVDVTDIKRAEEELRRAHDELEIRVLERTSELVRAKEAAESAAEAKAAFLANMSHELRTPMNAVIGMTSLLLDEDLNKTQRDYVEIIRNGGEAMLALISDILDFSRADKNKINLEHQPFSLRHSIEESLGMVAPEAEKKGLSLAHTVSFGTPDAIVGDQGRLRQILVNLLSNAVKFTDQGEVSISISSKAIGESKHQFLFAVRDTGIGIPVDKMNWLFEPFCQIEYSLSQKRDGAGLGLAISKRLVELMGGRIWAESEAGKGSVFHFTIEADITRDLPARPGPEVPAKSFENIAENYPLSILVAEDETSNQKVILEMLRRLGYRADALADGVEVLESLENRPYDLIFMDVRMPRMDGITAAREIRRRWPDNGPKIVAITAYALSGDRDKCLEAGMDGYIAKPIQVGELARILKRCASESHSGCEDSATRDACGDSAKSDDIV